MSAGLNLTLEELSTRLGLSTRQTKRLLMEHYGKTFLQKKTEAKMSAASILLKNPRISIAEAADESGYSSPEHFSNAFRRYYGISPRKWREKEGTDTE